MIVSVVNVLKVVHIHHDHSKRAAVAPSPVEFVVQLLVDRAHVKEPCEVINIHQLKQLLIGLMKLIMKSFNAKLALCTLRKNL